MSGLIDKTKLMLKTIYKYQHLRCTFYISLLAIITLIVSMIVNVSPLDSILQNIFAGLVTGIVITLIGSIKNKELKDAEIEKQFLETIHNLYLSSRERYLEYRKSIHADTNIYDEVTYELITELEAIEAYIGFKDSDARLNRILKKKPSDFFDDGENYDYAEQKRRHKKLYERFDSTINHDEAEREKIDQEIGTICRAHRILNRKVLKRTGEVFEEKIEIETSIP